jgi:hypothetical protein
MREADALYLLVSPGYLPILPTANYQRAYGTQTRIVLRAWDAGMIEKQGTTNSFVLGWEMDRSAAGIASAMLRN